MENAILNILLKNVNTHKYSIHSAEEIASMMQKFIEWLTTVDYNYQIVSNTAPHQWWNIGKEKYNLNELFDYWHDEIYKKEEI